MGGEGGGAAAVTGTAWHFRPPIAPSCHASFPVGRSCPSKGEVGGSVWRAGRRAGEGSGQAGWGQAADHIAGLCADAHSQLPLRSSARELRASATSEAAAAAVGAWSTYPLRVLDPRGLAPRCGGATDRPCWHVLRSAERVLCAAARRGPWQHGSTACATP
jgi:hypothetical protein